MAQNRTIQLPEELCARADAWLTGRFENLEALLRFLLQEMMSEDSAKLDQAEEELVEQRLKDLGYL